MSRVASAIVSISVLYELRAARMEPVNVPAAIQQAVLGGEIGYRYPWGGGTLEGDELIARVAALLGQTPDDVAQQVAAALK